MPAQYTMSSIYDPASEDFLHNVFDFDAASGETSTQHFDSAFEIRDMEPLHRTILDQVDIEGAEPLGQTEDHSMADTTAYDMNSNAAGRFASSQHLGSIFQDHNVGAGGNSSLQNHRVLDGSNSFPGDDDCSLQDIQPPGENDGFQTAYDFQLTCTNGKMANARELVGADTESSSHQISEPIGVSFFFRPTLMGHSVS